ncbi:MAG: L,D-transpeptidase [Candidatus Sericytochromatia bacterium]|nr:L,D-transpeptidase [Candidatus Sericytochromatia bacterium]
MARMVITDRHTRPFSRAPGRVARPHLGTVRRVMLHCVMLAAATICHPAWARQPAQVGTLPSPWQWRTISGHGFAYTVRQSLTLKVLAEAYDLSARQLAVGNAWPLDLPLPVGSRVWLSDQRIVPGRSGSGGLVNIPEGRFDLVLDGVHVGSWPVSIGTRHWPTPIGRFPLGRPVWHPAWLVPRTIRAESLRQGHPLPVQVPPGPLNPLGDVWLALGRSGVGLHGMPSDPGRWPDAAMSHGCLRMAPSAVRQVAAKWRPGLWVDVTYVRVKSLQIQGEGFVEVHPDPYAWQEIPPKQLWGMNTLDTAFCLIWMRACGWPWRWPQ